jgi:hypothetical protein
MKFLFQLLALGCIMQASAQNVGIGTSTPAQKLDVAGSVNISGTIMANGVAGTSGQALTSTGSGLAWTSLGSGAGFKKCVCFNIGGNGSWTVPAGVTEVMIEVWGGGSAGTTFCGGTSGGYARTVQPVTPGTALNYIVGKGSYGAASTTQDAGFSQVTIPSAGYITAYGGGGLWCSEAGIIYTLKGEQKSGYSTFDNSFFTPGNVGESNVSNYGMKNSTTYVETVHFGRGGIPVGTFNPYPTKGDVYTYENGILRNFSGAHSSFSTRPSPKHLSI